MPITIEQHDTDEREPLPPRTRRPVRRRTLVMLIVCVGLPVLLVGIVLGRLLVGSSPETAPDAGADPTAPAGPGATGAPLAELPRSEARFGQGGSTTLWSTQVGYSRTVQSGIEAALNYDVVFDSLDYMLDGPRREINSYVFASPELAKKVGVSDEVAAATRKKWGVSPTGDPLTNGKPDPSKRIYSAAYTQYGAFQIVSADTSTVHVKVWRPVVWGIGTPTSLGNTTVSWPTTDITVAWRNGDWRIVGYGTPAYDTKPVDAGQVVNSFKERAGLLGDGWVMAANATEESSPDLDLPKEG